MDSGSVVGLWVVMIAAGFGLAFFVHLGVKKRSVWSVLGSGVIPVLLYGSYIIYELAMEPGALPFGEELILLAYLSIHGLISSMIGALIGAWLGSGIRTIIDLARAD